MTCDRIRPLLSSYHDDGLSLDERARVRAHVATCAECSAILAAYEALYRALNTVDAPAPPDLRRNVYARIAALEARQGTRLPFGPALLGMLRSAGSTAGLLAVLAALVAAVIRLGSPQPAASPLATSSAVDFAAASTAVSSIMGAQSRASMKALPAPAQTAAAALRPVLAAGATMKVKRTGRSGSTLKIVAAVIARTSSGAPRAAIPLTADIDMKSQAPVLKSMALGTPLPFPTIPPGDGLVYLHLDNSNPLLPNGGNAPAQVEWHQFAPAGRWRVLVTPGPSRAQLFTGITTSLDGTTVAYSAMGVEGYGGIFSFSLSNPAPRRVLGVPDISPANAGFAHHFVKQVYPAADGGLLYSLIDSGSRGGTASVFTTTAPGASPAARVGNPWQWYNYVLSPDRRHLIWAQGPLRPAGIWRYGTLLDLTLGTRPLTRTIGLGAHPVWSPDSSSVLYWSPQPRGLYVWSIRTGQSKRVVPLDPAGPGLVNAFAWAPSGRFFAYVVSTPGSTSQVWLGDSQTGLIWKSFARPYIGAIAWAHRPVGATGAAPATATAVSGPVTIAVRSGAAQVAVQPGGTAQVPYGSGIVYVVVSFPTQVDWRTVTLQAAGWSVELKNALSGNRVAFGLHGIAPGTVPLTITAALGPGGRPALAGPVHVTVQAFPPDVAVPTPFSSTAGPTDVLRSFYNAINRREYTRAYGYLASTDNRTLATFARGYADTAYDTIMHLTPAPYLSASSFHATTCVGIQFVAHRWNGQMVSFGGWYQVTSTAGQNPHFTGWRIVVLGPRTHIEPGLPDTVPSQSRCTAPPQQTATSQAR